MALERPVTAAIICGLALGLTRAPAVAEEAPSFTREQLRVGAEIFARNCSPCHGARMLDPQAAFDLRKFPPDQKNRFVISVVKGKNQMPPWGDLFKPEDIDALWAYVMAGERQ